MKTITLTLGKFKTSAAYLKEIEKTRSVSTYARKIAEKVEIGKKQQVDVALLSFADLDITKSYATTQDIRDAAAKLGYLTPTAEVGLALAFKEQEVGEWWITLHEPIADSDCSPYVLFARRGGDGRWVGAAWGNPGGQWDAGDLFAFVVPASKRSALKPSALALEPFELRVKNLEAFQARVIELIPGLESLSEQ